MHTCSLVGVYKGTSVSKTLYNMWPAQRNQGVHTLEGILQKSPLQGSKMLLACKPEVEAWRKTIHFARYLYTFVQQVCQLKIEQVHILQETAVIIHSEPT